MNSVSNNLFNVNIYTPKGLFYSEKCESVIFSINANTEAGDFGSYGVKKGHADAVFSVGEGKILLKKDGKIFSFTNCSDGFAVMDKGILNITLEKIREDLD